ncbi:uncharacterized protein OCT59_027489 [Rhizophagus irregularis]|uniref:uncharacterized protein n=1 Tax=Rhizophagus irregularis TaxID=588596 RepID=UPI00332180D4|nr:hypothetical protein OCT59_027489 [Rhizophagus irregularis]
MLIPTTMKYLTNKLTTSLVYSFSFTTTCSTLAICISLNKTGFVCLYLHYYRPSLRCPRPVKFSQKIHTEIDNVPHVITAADMADPFSDKFVAAILSHSKPPTVQLVLVESSVTSFGFHPC